uniref:Baculoviral IAP repeat-containing protein 5 isoform X2 n=1 Tax=Pogona vitticeps TaxID=103695 RepID=A0ABM5FN11_9SAUR
MLTMEDGAFQVPPGFELFLKEGRVATFSQWPFVSDCSCTPDRMAEAGFIHCPAENAPDVAECFVCFKELEGWEPDDDPMKEHQKHSPNCAFLTFQKDVADLTVQEFLRLCKERMINMVIGRVHGTPVRRTRS